MVVYNKCWWTYHGFESVKTIHKKRSKKSGSSIWISATHHEVFAASVYPTLEDTSSELNLPSPPTDSQNFSPPHHHSPSRSPSVPESKGRYEKWLTDLTVAGVGATVGWLVGCCGLAELAELVEEMLRTLDLGHKPALNVDKLIPVAKWTYLFIILSWNPIGCMYGLPIMTEFYIWLLFMVQYKCRQMYQSHGSHGNICNAWVMKRSFRIPFRTLPELTVRTWKCPPGRGNTSTNHQYWLSILVFQWCKIEIPKR